MNLSIRKYVAAFSVIALLSTFLVSASVVNAQTATDYGDVVGDEWFVDNVQWGLDSNILDPTQPNFRAGDPTTRAELTKMIVNAVPVPNDGTCDETLYPDVDANHWGCQYITAASGVFVSGMGAGHEFEGYFLPNNPVLRAEASKMIVDGFGLTGDGTLGSDYFTDVPVGEWYDTYMGIAHYNCVFRGVDNGNTVEPGRNIVRAEAIAIVDRGANPSQDCLTGEVVPGDLTLSLDGASPEGSSVPRNADVLMGIFALEAEGSDAELQDITFYLEGLNDDTDIDRVRIEQQGFTIADRSVNSSDGSVAFSNVGLTADQGMRTTFELVAQLDAAENAEIKFCVNSPDDVTAVVPGTTTPVSVGGSFPICTNLFRTTSSTVGVLTYSVDDNVGDLNFGDRDRLIRVDLDADNREDICVTSFTFENQGSADADAFADWEIRVGTDTPVFETAWNGDYVTFRLPDCYIVPDGSSRVFEFWSTIAGGIGDDVLFDVEEDWDIKGIGEDTHYGVRVVEGTVNTLVAREILGGDLAIAFTGIPIVGDISQGDEKELATFNFATGGAGVTIDGMSLDVCYDGNAVNQEELSDIKWAVWDEGTGTWDVLAGPESPDVGAVATPLPSCITLNYNDTFDLPADSTTPVSVIADIDDAALDGAVYWVEFDTSTIEAEFTSDGTNLQAGDITGGLLISNEQTVADPTLTANLAVNPPDRDIVAGTNQIEVANWTLQASTADDLTVTSIQITCDYDETLGVNDGDDCRNVFTNLELHLESGSPAAPTLLEDGESFSAGASGVATFSNLDDGDSIPGMTIPAGNTFRIALYSDSSKVGETDEFADFYMNGSGAIEVQDSDFQTLTAAQKFISSNPRRLTLLGSGLLTSSKLTDDSIKSRVLIGDAMDENVIKVRFSASEDEPWIINDLRVIAGDVAAGLAPLYASADTTTNWSAVGTLSLLSAFTPADIQQAQGLDSIGLTAPAVLDEVVRDRGAAFADAYDFAIINYYVHDDEADSNYQASLCEGAATPISGGTCYALNGGGNLVEGEWVQEVIDVSGDAVNQYFGLVVDAASGVVTNDGVFVDSIEFHTRDTLQDAISEINVDCEDIDSNPLSRTTSMVLGVADFSSLGCYVPINGTSDVVISANIGTVSNTAAAPGTPVRLVMSNLEFEAQGASSNELRTGVVPVSSNYQRIARNAPVLAKDTLDSSLGSGLKGLYKFTMTELNAGAGEHIGIKQLAYDITSTGPTMDQFRILQDGSDLVGSGEALIIDSVGNDLTTTANNITTDTVYVQFVTEATVDDTSAFELQAVISGVTPTQSISAVLLNDSANANVNTPAGVAGCVIDDTTSTIPPTDNVSYDIDGDCDGNADTVGVDSGANFIWSDWSKAGGGIHDNDLGTDAALSSADWLDGVFVENLTTLVSHSLEN